MADLTPHAADSGLITNAVTQIGTAVLGAGVLWRVIVAWGRQDRAARMEAELRGELRQRLDQTQQALDRMAHERNEAVQVRLQLETRLAMTEDRLTVARRERDEARAALARLQGDVERLTVANHRLTEEVAVAEASAQPRCAPTPAPAQAQPAPKSAKSPRQVPGERPWGR